MGHTSQGCQGEISHGVVVEKKSLGQSGGWPYKKLIMGKTIKVQSNRRSRCEVQRGIIESFVEF